MILMFVQSSWELGVEVNKVISFMNTSGIFFVRQQVDIWLVLYRPSTVNRDPDFIVTLFVSHVRPLLDYCSCIWNMGLLP